MIFKNSLIIGIFSLVSLLLAIVRDRLLAGVVGVGPVLDVYNAAFRLPDLMYGALLAFVSAGTVVPFLTKENKQGNIIDPRHKLYSLTFFFAGIISILAVIVGITLPLYAHLVVPGFNAQQLEQFIFATRLLLLQPFFMGITALISCLAQLRNEFIIYGIAPLGYSFSIILGIIFLYPIYGLSGLLYGVTLGSLASCCIQAISLRKAKIRDLHYHFNYHHIKELIQLALPRTGTNIVTQVRVIFLTGLATTFGPGGLSSFLFAQRVSDAVIQLVQQSLTTASLPVLSKDFLEGKNGEYRQVMKRYVTVLGSIGLVVSLFVAFFREEVVYLLYGDTGFNSLITFFLIGFLILLPLMMMSGYLAVGLYASKDTRSVFIAGLVSSLLCFFIGTVTKEQGPISLLYALGAWSVTNFLLLFVLYSRKK